MDETVPDRARVFEPIASLPPERSRTPLIVALLPNVTPAVLLTVKLLIVLLRNALFVIAEDGTKSPAPAGTHETESGLKVEVDAEGKIISAETKAEETEKVEVEVEAAAEDTIPASETPEEIAKKEAAVGEAMKKVVMALEEMSAEMAKMKAKMSEMESKYEKFSKTPGAEKAPKVTRGEFNAINDALDAKIATLSELKGEGFFRKA